MKSNQVAKGTPDAVRSLCAEIIEATSQAAEERSHLVARLMEMVNGHTSMDRKLVYLPLKSRTKMQRRGQGQDDRDVATKLMCELSVLSEEDKRWALKMGMLSEMIYRHFVKEERTGFPARTKLTSLSHLLNMAEEFLSKPKPNQHRAVILRLIKNDKC